MELKIYNGNDGTLKLTASPNSSSTLTEEVMGEYCVSASFTHTAFVKLDANDYVQLQGVKYKIRSPYRPAQKNTQTYQYNVKFYAPIHDAEDALFLFQADGEMTTEFSYDGTPLAHLRLWVDNMNRIAGQALWTVGTVIGGENKTIEYKNVYCWDAAFGSSGIAATFGTELLADGYTVNLCKAERGERIELGYLQGLTQLSQEDNGDVRFFTRLFPLGSTRNINASQYGYARLQLPSRAKYVDKNTELYGIKDAYEESAFSGIYPRYTGTVTAVRTERQTNEEGREYTIYYIKDSGMGFNPNDYEIPEQVKMLAFQTGDLSGRGDQEDGSFQANWHADTGEWEIINVYPDETTQLPGGEIIPKVGDTYIPWNFSLPDEYISAAEQEYAEAVDEFLSTYSFDTQKYNGTTDRNYIENNGTPLIVGQNVRLLSTEYFTAGYKDTRVTKVVRKLCDLCQATVTCTDRIGTGWKSSVDNRLENLQYELARQSAATLIDIIKSGDAKTPSDNNVFSALRSLAMFLRKDKEDSTEHLIKFLKGLECGEFNQGSTGVGIYQDDLGNWHIETDYLDVRLKFTATTVEIQRAYHIGGQQIKSVASMKCVRVEELADVYRCYMNTVDDDGNEITNDFRVNDQAYVNTFNLVKQADGKVGNHFLWRLVVAVGADYIDLSKTQCASGSDEPKANDDIVLLGYQGTDDPSRQCAVIDAGAGNGAPYYRQYVGINSFTLPEPENQLKPGDNELSGRFHIEQGSTGWQNMDGLPEEIQTAMEAAQGAQDSVNGIGVGSVNLLLNSGFTGNYENEDLKSGSGLESGTELYSDSLKNWNGEATVQDDANAVSGKSATVGNLSQTVSSLIADEHYVVSYKAKGTSVTVSCGGYTVTQPLTSAYQKYVHKFTFSGSGAFGISGTATVCDLQLERGTIATDWKPSPMDNEKWLAEFQTIQYLKDAIKNGSVDAIGGLILATMIQLGNYKNGGMQKVTAGLSGVYNDDDDVYTWGGGTLEQAIYTVMKYKSNPNYEPTDAELRNMAKAVITHGGRAILNDVIVRGYIHALGGVFKGKVEIADGKILLNEDGSGHLADGAYYWDQYGTPYVKRDSRIIWRDLNEEDVTMLDPKLGNYIHGLVYATTRYQYTLPVPSAEYEEEVLHIRGMATTRMAAPIRIYPDSPGELVMYDTETKSYKEVDYVSPLATFIVSDITCVNTGAEYKWVADSTFDTPPEDTPE